MELKDRVAIVTGASSGIGEVIAKFYLGEGAKVLGCGLKASSSIVDENYSYIQANLKDEKKAEIVAIQCQKNYGKIDILVNCAGVTGIGNIYNTSVEEFKNQFEVNVFALYNITKAATPFIQKSEYGVIINISSELGVKAVPDRIAYCPSKAAVEMLTRCLAIDLAPEVRVNAILPGLTETPMTKMRFDNAPNPDEERKRIRNRYPLKRMCTTDDVANGAVFLASDKSSFITGEMLAVCGGGHIFTCS